MLLRVRMAPRDPDEQHRTATPLELLLDLAFVVAVAQAADSLHHGLVDGHAANALVSFPLVFFAIFWAWVNMAWFGSAYDNDDVPYRLAVFVQMTGVLILAAGVPRAFNDRDFTIVAVGYVVMRLALVGQWLRVAASIPSHRRTALRYAVGVATLQVGWLLRLAIPDGAWSVPTFFLLAAAEMAVPVWAERAGRTPWHARHIVERYGLFTIIVLGETVLSSTVAVQVALDNDSAVGDLAPVIVGALLIVFSMWWIYFTLPSERLVERAKREFAFHGATSFIWGYGHYVVFGAVAATGAGLAVAVDQAIGDSELSDVRAGLAATVPIAVYMVAVWALHYREKPPGPLRTAVPLAGATVVVASSVTPEPVLVSGVVLAGVVALSVMLSPERRAIEGEGPGRDATLVP